MKRQKKYIIFVMQKKYVVNDTFVATGKAIKIKTSGSAEGSSPKSIQRNTLPLIKIYYYQTKIGYNGLDKGQLISKCLLDVIVLTNKPTKIFLPLSKMEKLYKL